MEQYLPVLFFFIIAGFISLFLTGLPFVTNKRKPDAVKISSYECGFPAFASARNAFNIRFYLVSILFIIFDLEITLLFPWSAVLRDIGASGFYSVLLFLTILAIGLLYEWKKGALDWEIATLVSEESMILIDISVNIIDIISFSLLSVSIHGSIPFLSYSY